MSELKSKMYEVSSKSQDLGRYRDFDVFYKQGTTFRLYKANNMDFDKGKVKQGKIPEKLYVSFNDKVSMIRKEQIDLNFRFKQSITIDIHKSREILNDLISVTLSEPRSEILVEIKDTIEDIVEEFLLDEQIVSKLTNIAIHDYSTQLHVTNVMLFSLGYAHYCKFSEKDIKMFAMMGLMHDVGKLLVPDHILSAPRKLTDEEFELIKKHPENGLEILVESGFEEKVQLAALEHHERLDGSGYPFQKKAADLSGTSRALGIIDMFEALTSWRPYKNSISPLKALALIKEDVDKGRLDSMIFKNFAYSIIGISEKEKAPTRRVVHRNESGVIL